MFVPWRPRRLPRDRAFATLPPTSTDHALGVLIAEVEALGVIPACVRRVAGLLVEQGRIRRLLSGIGVRRPGAGRPAPKLHGSPRFRGRLRPNHDELPHGHRTSCRSPTTSHRASVKVESGAGCKATATAVRDVSGFLEPAVIEASLLIWLVMRRIALVNLANPRLSHRRQVL